MGRAGARSIIRHAVGGGPAVLANGVHGVQGGARRHAEPIQETVSVGVAAAAVSGDNARHVCPVSRTAPVVIQVGRAIGARFAGFAVAAILRARDDVEVRMIPVNAGIGDGHGHPAAVVTNGGKESIIAGLGHPAGRIIRDDLI